MKVLLVNGSPRGNGDTAAALQEMQKVFEEEGVECKVLHVGNKDVRGCLACNRCGQTGQCVIDDIVNETRKDFEECDGMVVGAPVYYASANATLVAYLTRLFYSSKFDKRMKVGASVTVARRGGCAAAFDELNKFFTLSNMPIATSQYWNNIYGWTPGEGQVDEEGRQIMRVLARNMVFLMKSIALGKSGIGLPETEERVWTNFTR